VSRLLVVTAVTAEAAALTRDTPPGALDVHPVGVGSATAAAGTARLLGLAAAAGTPYRAVVSAGIGGGYPAVVALGGTVLATRCTAADLGADSPEGFLSLDELGIGSASTPVDENLLRGLASAVPDAYAGPVLSVNTVTGTADGAAELLRRFPDAVAEAMEGYGVGVAAAQFGLPFAELRTISNPVGPRDRAAWRLDLAFGALAEAGTGIVAALATGSLKAWL